VFALTQTSVEELPPIDFSLEEGRKYIVSVGSVGQPRDYDPRASYTLYDSEAHVFSYKRADYDIKASADKIFNSDLEPNFGHRLFIGV
jgi:diadenosine tetraphosphatase ApaH/serine/threonine PP2A family protein phosphatase